MDGPQTIKLFAGLDENADGARATCRHDIALMRADSRDTLREAVLRRRTPFVTPRMISGWAALRADCAAVLSPDSIAVSTFFTKVRTRLIRARLTSVRRWIWRTRFFADVVFGM